MRVERSGRGGRHLPGAGAGDWLSQERIAQSARESGHRERIVLEEHGCLEVKGTQGGGARVEIHFHPAAGEVVKGTG